MKDNFFSPSSVTVNAGDTVTWTNQGTVAHTATGSGFDSGSLDPGKSFSHKFTSAGTFSYVCTFHQAQGMTGTVTVASKSGSGGGSGSSGGGSNGSGSSGSTAGLTGAGSESAAGSSSSAAGSSTTLPKTGLAALPLAGLGALLLAAGFGLRRRAS
jgi:LPXTG-motif cell wall-anchored protein